MTRSEAARRLAALEAVVRARPPTGLDYSVLSVEELRELRGWIVACGEQDMAVWKRSPPAEERHRFRYVFAKLVEGQST